MLNTKSSFVSAAPRSNGWYGRNFPAAGGSRGKAPAARPQEEPQLRQKKKETRSTTARHQDIRLAHRSLERFRVDVTQIAGLELPALQLFSEVGRDLSRWRVRPVSFPGLCSARTTTSSEVAYGGAGSARSITVRANCFVWRRTRSTAALPRGKLPREDEGQTRTAGRTHPTAHKIAVIFYTMIKNQPEYDLTIWEQRDVQRRGRHTASLKRQAERLGYKLIPIQEAV